MAVKLYSCLQDDIHDPYPAPVPFIPAVPGGVNTDPASSGPPTDTTGTEDTPRTEGVRVYNSGKGVLACSLVAVLAAAVLPVLSLLC